MGWSVVGLRGCWAGPFRAFLLAGFACCWVAGLLGWPVAGLVRLPTTQQLVATANGSTPQHLPCAQYRPQHARASPIARFLALVALSPLLQRHGNRETGNASHAEGIPNLSVHSQQYICFSTRGDYRVESDRLPSQVQPTMSSVFVLFSPCSALPFSTRAHYPMLWVEVASGGSMPADRRTTRFLVPNLGSIPLGPWYADCRR